MAELGNTLVNRCYEANVNEIIAKRATSMAKAPERDAWIRAKYIARAFVRSDFVNGALSLSIEPDQTWAVHKLRRRTKNGRINTTGAEHLGKEHLDIDEKDNDTKDLSPNEAIPDSDSLMAACGPILAKTSSTNGPLNAEKLLFGCSLGKHHVSNIEVGGIFFSVIIVLIFKWSFSLIVTKSLRTENRMDHRIKMKETNCRLIGCYLELHKYTICL